MKAVRRSGPICEVTARFGILFAPAESAQRGRGHDHLLAEKTSDPSRAVLKPAQLGNQHLVELIELTRKVRQVSGPLELRRSAERGRHAPQSLDPSSQRIELDARAS